jgi:hypothetical protein
LVSQGIFLVRGWVAQEIAPPGALDAPPDLLIGPTLVVTELEAIDRSQPRAWNGRPRNELHRYSRSTTALATLLWNPRRVNDVHVMVIGEYIEHSLVR